MKLDSITLHQIRMPLVRLETSFSRAYHSDIIVEVASMAPPDGEVTAGENPFYNEEWTIPPGASSTITSLRECSTKNSPAPRTSSR